MSITRRELLRTGATAAALAALAGLPRPLYAHLGGRRATPVAPIQDPRLRALADRALETARAAGATYADVRLSHDRARTISAETGGQDSFYEIELLSVGVRALVDGYWGFASSTVWSPDELARLGREAVAQARTHALGKPRVVELAPIAVPASGHWLTPMAMDPFTVSPLEMADLLVGLDIHASQEPDVAVEALGMMLADQARAFGSTEGAWCTQRTVRTSANARVILENRKGRVERMLPGLTPAGLGWEYVREQPLRDRLRAMVAEMREDLALPMKPVQVGREDVVLDAASMATLLHETLGAATELDRALGYEANAGGTSYLNQPLAMLGVEPVAAPLVQVRADRTSAGGCATVGWDDEGVAPEPFTLVKDGVLDDFQTTREGAGWLRASDEARGRPFRSRGCAAAATAESAPLSRVPNLALAPGAGGDFDALVRDVARGFAFRGLQLDMDFQRAGGLGLGLAYEVRDGKRVARVPAAGVLFRSRDLWKAIATLGDDASVERFGLPSEKGQPVQHHWTSVSAPPALLRGLTIIDPLRKA